MTNVDAEREFDSMLKEFGELCAQLRPHAQDLVDAFRIPREWLGTEILEPLVPPRLFDTGGTTGTIRLDFSQSSGGGSSRSTSNSLTTSSDIRIGVTVGVEFPFGSAEVSAGHGWSASETTSSAEIQTSDWVSSQSTGISMNKPPLGPPTRAYQFAPVFNR